jgi:hypothetical protein
MEMDIKMSILGNVVASKPTKTSLTNINIANCISEYISAALPKAVEFSLIENGIWFTGSRVWSQIYYITPSNLSDWDIVCIDETESKAEKLATNLCNYCSWPYNIKTNKYGTIGYLIPQIHSINPLASPTSVNVVTGDVWWNATSISNVLSGYPQKSHAHCRIAYSFTEGLVMLPNPLGWTP